MSPPARFSASILARNSARDASSRLWLLAAARASGGRELQ
jgi:hypothetical protein